MMKRKNILVFAALTALVAALAVYGVMQYIHTVQEEKQLRMEISGYTVAGEALLDAARADTANEDAYAWRYRQMLLAAGAVEARWDTAIGMRFREDRYDQGKTFVLAVIDTPSMFLPVSLEEAGQEEESLAMLEEYLRLLSGANDVLRTEGMKAFLTALSESGDVAAWLAALSA
ncbi:hypothetical protein JQM68_13010 [Oscillibacter valericigenes]|uniref:hypothetical protein n=1 Tax=Oscillibacter valericigenes TaxID=351091 RepID=UPI001F3FB258|nr:hypothetical protein [Oscillibacter valericigenes]MCF2618104.1 hypothetical protein [Oscillibacter valericigenes]